MEHPRRQPAITVIVPMHNVEPYLDDALASLSGQSFSDFEAILVDDGSIDGTMRIARERAGADPRFRIIEQDHGGLSAARNRGLDEARGEYIAFLDADDVLPEDAYANLHGTLSTSGSDFVAGAYVRLRPGDDGYELGVVQPWIEQSNPGLVGTTLAEHPEAVANIVAWSKLSRRDFWERHSFRFPVGELYEDQVLAARFYAQATSFDMIPEVVYHWRIRAEGTSITQREQELATLAACLQAMTGMLDALDEAGHGTAAQARLRQNLQRDLPRLAQAAEQGGHEHLATLAATVAASLARAEETTLDALTTDELARLRSLAAFAGHLESVDH
ncbi:glycosyltransferase family 2 protein [Plantibacter sp. Mn2098]|uniref:glycosyltransferase family 2 protein n=1 Tax=Plantibacter sp. Mn2098 TaxID=3395266 RepID=UPI003BE1F361